MQCQTTELKALLKAEAGKTQLAQEQQMAAQAESAAEVANLRSLLECEVEKGAQAEEQHKAAQADLAEQLRHATSLLTHQLEQERLNTPMLARCPRTEELVQKVAELQVWPCPCAPTCTAALCTHTERGVNQLLLRLQECELLTQPSKSLYAVLSQA